MNSYFNFHLHLVTHCVWSSFDDWSTCSRSCGRGQKSRTRLKLIAASNGGRECTGDATEKITCNIQACPVNCSWGAYGKWSPCSTTCGKGEKIRSRSKLTRASNGGRDCIGDATEKTICNIQACPVDCKWGAYDWWSPCSKTCGEGEMTRSRSVVIPASNGGNECLGNATEIIVCNEEECKGS